METPTNKQLYDFLKPLSIDNRIEELNKLFDHYNLFDDTDSNIYKSTLGLIQKERLSIKIDNFLSMLYDIDIVEHAELEAIINKHFAMPKDVDENIYIKKLNTSLEELSETISYILKDRIINASQYTTQPQQPVVKKEGWIQLAKLAKLCGTTNGLFSGYRNNKQYFHHATQEGANKTVMIPWSDVDVYVERSGYKHFDKWEEYKKTH